MIVVNGRFLLSKVTGVQRFAISLSKELAKIAGDEILFIAPKGDIDNQLKKELNIIQISPFLGHLWEQVTLPLYLKRNGSPLLVSLSGLSPFLYKKAVLTIHDMSLYHNKNWFNWKYNVFYKLSYFLLKKRVKKFITVSEFSKLEIIKYLGVDKNDISVIYNSCSFSLNRQQQNSFESKCVFNILAVSSLDSRKNFELIIDAVIKMNDENIKLSVVGEGGAVFNMKEIKNTHSGINFLGYISDNKLIELYRNASVFIYPSLYEGFGIPPLEAMSQGCPVIASNSSSIPEACGNAAMFFDPLSVDDLIKKIHQIRTDMKIKNELISNGYERSVFFNSHVEAIKLIELLRGIK